MTVQELLPLVRQLDRPDKLRLMQTILYDLAQEEGVSLPNPKPLLPAEQTYPVWSPMTAYNAADTLLHLLKDQEADGG